MLLYVLWRLWREAPAKLYVLELVSPALELACHHGHEFIQFFVFPGPLTCIFRRLLKIRLLWSKVFDSFHTQGVLHVGRCQMMS